MISINKIINSKESRPRWRFTKYYTGVEKTPEELRLHIQQEEQDEFECFERPTDIKSISEYVKKWTQDHVGVDFKFRQYQFEYIVQVLHNILNGGVKINCIEAPTGSGKSWFAFIISGVAWEYYRKTSYILVSDLGLMDQYMNDVDKFKFNDIGRMKGLANYRCELNNMAFPSGECKMHKVPYNILMNPHLAEQKGYYCTEECPCIIDRKKAIVSPITIMTYVLYLCYMNDVLPLYDKNGADGLPPFDMRDIVICDEVHKMPDIVQNWCSPEFFEDYDVGEMEKIIDFLNEEGMFNDISERDKCTAQNLRVFQHKIIENISNKKDAFKYFNKYFNIQDILASKIDQIRDTLQIKEDVQKELSKKDKEVLFVCTWLENRHLKFKTYNKVMEQVGHKHMVINSVFDSKTKTYDKKKFTINCVYEEWLVNEFFNNKSKNELMMTATIGDYNLFRREIGVDIWDNETREKNFRFLRIPSTFDFSQSPIYVLPNYKMTYSMKDENMPKVVDLIDRILAFHQNQKGIIHTGSYEFSRKLFSYANQETRNRLLCYSDSKNKEYYLDEFGYSSNKVLAGPTLTTGLNMPDDDCRFMIIMKVPYPSLGDQLVKAKKNVIAGWYDGETFKTMIQSFGRGIRHKNDWCVTYVIDGSFCHIFEKAQTQNYLTPELVKRIQYVTL